MNPKFYLLLLALFFVGSAAIAQKPTKTISDDDLIGGQSYQWSKDTIYLLDGFVYLEAGGILNIQEGTLIKGIANPTSNDLASSLIITKGAQIFARGTARAPIIFTAEDDTQDLLTSSIAAEDRGLWGGLILLGNASITDEAAIEAVEGLDAEDPRSIFGGANDTDNSGVLSYVSIRHGGAELAPGEEINGLTLGGIGSGTTLEFIEVLSNSDDGIEFFGGTVDLKYASVAFCGDDAIDWDTGWRGNGQFWFVIQSATDGDNAAEMDGAKPDANTPSSNPQIFNVTYVGSGVNGTAKNEHALLFRDGTRGSYSNSIFTDFANFAIQVEDRASGVDSRSYMEAGELVLSNNIWFGFGEGTELNAGNNGIIQATGDAEDPTAQFLVDHLSNNSNTVEDPQLGGISRAEGSRNLDPRIGKNSPAYTGNLNSMPNHDFFSIANYKGAFSNTLWIRNWTGLDYYEFLPTVVERLIKDEDLIAGKTYNWSADTTYILDGFVYLEAGGTLNIEAGTVIKGAAIPSTNDLASTLIITQGATINAIGTANAPIIFTTEDDDLEDAEDLRTDDRGLWGGLILLGNATITDEAATESVEGLNADDPRSTFGGSNDADNSGILKYVSIRHGGAELAPGEEINGLTLGGIGSGTTLEYIEVLSNSDDGIEFFGGTVDLKYASVAFCGDDAIDWDTGWRGKGQFWFVLQSADAGDNAAEMDGAKPDANTPSSNPQIYNVTYIGSGVNGTAKNEHALLFRDGSKGRYSNSIFTDFANYGIQVEDRASGVDSRSYMEAGELVLSNNIWFGFGEGNELNTGANGFIQATGDAEDPTAQFLIDHLTSNGNSAEDPQLGGISRTIDGRLDPRPSFDGPAYVRDAREAYPANDNFYSDVIYRGAFCSEGAWIARWTALAQYGILSENVPFTSNCGLSTNTESFVKSEKGVKLIQNIPNPVNNFTQIGFELPSKSRVNLVVFNLEGRIVANLISNERRSAGSHKIEFNAKNLEDGIYFYSLITEEVKITKPMIINR